MLSAAEVDGALADVLPPEVWAMYRDRGLGDLLARYVQLIVRWNRVVNLTAIREPGAIVRRHVAESFCCAAILPNCDSVLDLGSGAGFPGVVIQLLRPELRVTLAESHGKKAAFLREVIRELAINSQVFAGRAQDLPPRSFGCVALRAVDPMAQALEAASELATDSVCVIGSPEMLERYEKGLGGWELVARDPASSTTDARISASFLFRRAR